MEKEKPTTLRENLDKFIKRIYKEGLSEEFADIAIKDTILEKAVDDLKRAMLRFYYKEDKLFRIIDNIFGRSDK